MFGMYDEFEANNNKNQNFVTTQQLKQDIIGEFDAVRQYDQHIFDSNNQLAKRTWQHIKQEELVHIGELLALWKTLDPTNFAFVEDGMNEFFEHKAEWSSE